MVVTLADMEGNESFDPKCLGECELVTEERVGDGELLYLRGCKTQVRGEAARLTAGGASGDVEGDRVVKPVPSCCPPDPSIKVIP